MIDVCDYCKKEKPWIKTKVYQGECIGSTEVHLCSKCYKNTLQKEQEKYIEKFLKLYFVESGFYEELKEGNPDLSLKDIKVALSAPESLNDKEGGKL